MDDRHGNAPPGSVRPAVRGDAAAIARVYSESVAARDSTMDTAPVDAATVIAWLDRLTDRETIVVVEAGGDVRGWGIVRRYSDRPGYSRTCETSVYLDRTWTRRGLGSLVQHALLAFCRRAGYHHVVAKIWADNVPSVALHERFGFTLVGVQKEVGFVEGRWRDVAIYQCLLYR